MAFNMWCDISAFKDYLLQLFSPWWLFYVFVENFKAIWSYMHIMHKGTISGSGISQKFVLYFIYQRFPHFPHLHLGIVHFHFVIIIHCNVYISFHFVPCRLSAHVANVSWLFVASATLNKIHLILSCFVVCNCCPRCVNYEYNVWLELTKCL